MSIRFYSILSAGLVSLCLSSCYSIPDSTSDPYNNSADSHFGLCAQINQALSSGPMQNASYINQPITSADEARLLKQYNQYGCDANTDQRYAFPDESLAVNTALNDGK